MFNELIKHSDFFGDVLSREIGNIVFRRELPKTSPKRISKDTSHRNFSSEIKLMRLLEEVPERDGLHGGREDMC